MDGIEKNGNSIKDLEKIDILSLEDDKIKSIGELLSNDTSRNIMKSLLKETMTANQISQNMNVSLPLVMYHLKKMQSIGLVKIVKTNVLEYEKQYATTKFALVVLPSSVTEEVKKSKSLYNSLKRVYRLTAIGICALISWTAIESIAPNPSMMRMPAGVEIIPEGLFWSTTVALTIIIVGLTMELFLSHGSRKN
ncbi:MAG: ArsR/SmtB family transcription factor [Nitrosotalea sp.]